METTCKNCGKLIDRPKYRIMKHNCYCDASCQLNYEYKSCARDKNKTVEKARLIANKKLLNFNWLNTNKSRDKLKEIMKTDDYRKKARECKLGENNPMYGKTPHNYIDGRYRKYGHADRGYNWKSISLEIKERDNNTCQLCGINKNLQVHHFEPYKSTQNNNSENLITVCSKCHAKIENQFYKVKEVSSEYVENINVYNIEVEDDHTYIVDGHVVHNCRSVLEVRVPK